MVHARKLLLQLLMLSAVLLRAHAASVGKCAHYKCVAQSKYGKGPIKCGKPSGNNPKSDCTCASRSHSVYFCPYRTSGCDGDCVCSSEDLSGTRLTGGNCIAASATGPTRKKASDLQSNPGLSSSRTTPRIEATDGGGSRPQKSSASYKFCSKGCDNQCRAMLVTCNRLKKSGDGSEANTRSCHAAEKACAQDQNAPDEESGGKSTQEEASDEDVDQEIKEAVKTSESAEAMELINSEAGKMKRCVFVQFWTRVNEWCKTGDKRKPDQVGCALAAGCLANQASSSGGSVNPGTSGGNGGGGNPDIPSVPSTDPGAGGCEVCDEKCRAVMQTCIALKTVGDGSEANAPSCKAAEKVCGGGAGGGEPEVPGTSESRPCEKECFPDGKDTHNGMTDEAGKNLLEQKCLPCMQENWDALIAQKVVRGKAPSSWKKGGYTWRQLKKGYFP